MTAPQIKGEGVPTRVHCAFDGSIAVNMYDLMYHDTNDVKPASSQADQGTEALNQAAFAPRFMGLAGDTRFAADTAALTDFPVLTDIVVEMDCTSATFEVGDLVTIDEDSGGTFLEDQKLSKTTDETLAIGQALMRYGSATTRVLVRLVSRVLKHNPAPDVTAEMTSATLPVLIFNGATGINEIRVPTNLADALSIEDSAGDLIKFDTTTGTQVITVTPATTFVASVTSPVVVFNGATGANEIRVPTNLADALSIESSAGDIVVLDTTTGTVVWNFSSAVRVNVLGDFQGGNATTDLVAFHGSTPTDQCAAYTQTYSTAARTVPAEVAAITGGESPTEAEHNLVVADVLALKKVVTAIIDDLQEKGLVG